MTKEDKNVPVGENIQEALEGANSPMAMLAASYNHAPHPMFRAFIDDRVMEILAVDMPKLKSCVSHSPAIAREGIESVVVTFQGALDLADEHMPEEAKSLTATIRDIGLVLAEALDKSIGRVLLEDTDANRMAYYDIISTHAKLVKVFSDLALTDEQKAQVSAELNGDDELDS